MEGIFKSKIQETPMAAAAAPSRHDKEEKIEQIVNDWWKEHINGSPVAEHSVGWNHLAGVISHLINRLKQEI